MVTADARAVGPQLDGLEADFVLKDAADQNFRIPGFSIHFFAAPNPADFKTRDLWPAALPAIEPFDPLKFVDRSTKYT